MNCKKTKILISASLDGELSRSERLALELHLHACAKCRQEQLELSALKQNMALWEDEKPSEWLAENFAESLRKLSSETVARKATVRRRWSVLGPATAALATAALAIAFLVHNQFQHQPVQIATPPPAVEYREAEPIKPEIAVVPDPEPEIAPVIEQQGSPEPPEAEPAQEYQRQRPAKTLVATKPTPAPRPAAADLRMQAETADTEIVIDPHTDLASTGAVPESREAAGGPVIAQSAVAYRVAENLGEAGLAMNMTVERVRGNLQKSVDLLISSPPVPAADTNGGNLL